MCSRGRRGPAAQLIGVAIRRCQSLDVVRAQGFIFSFFFSSESSVDVEKELRDSMAAIKDPRSCQLV